MQLVGMILTNCPPDQVVHLLSDPVVLQKVAPKGCAIGTKAGETVPFVMRRKVGPINLTMNGELTVRKTSDGATYAMELKAGHMIAGRVKLLLNLAPHPAATGKSSLNWIGTLEAHGLASRLVEERVDQVQTILTNLFQRLRTQAEGPEA